MIDYYSRVLHLQKSDFDSLAIDLFHYQYNHNAIYRQYCDLLKVKKDNVNDIDSIPFLPIQFYKSQIIKTGEWSEEKLFLSSGTSQMQRSQHFIKSLNWYEQISYKIFLNQILEDSVDIKSVKVIGLLPGYIDNPNSSLLHMIQSFASRANHEVLMFDRINGINDFLNNSLHEKLIIFGVSFALYDCASSYTNESSDLIIIETGGMKTDKRAISKNQILLQLKSSFPNAKIMSEYGMTELMSQAYSSDDFKYKVPNWMKVIITAIDDPLTQISNGKRGRINIIDLANIDTCCFIHSGDAGIVYDDNSFEVLGRLQEEELRGCNFMV